jgi:hypothetical protein
MVSDAIKILASSGLLGAFCFSSGTSQFNPCTATDPIPNGDDEDHDALELWVVPFDDPSHGST